ncbi:hypothetical protein FRB90_002101 [Tulasnella sp. 427]|nr:hypothetical protein FRB90_002101 [Tulasnella sp. 427]
MGNPAGWKVEDPLFWRTNVTSFGKDWTKTYANFWDRVYAHGRGGWEKRSMPVEKDLQPKLRALYEYGMSPPTEGKTEKANRTYVFNTWRRQMYISATEGGGEVTTAGLVPEMEELLEDLEEGREMCYTAREKAGGKKVQPPIERIREAVEALNSTEWVGREGEMEDDFREAINAVRRALVEVGPEDDTEWTLDVPHFPEQPTAAKRTRDDKVPPYLEVSTEVNMLLKTRSRKRLSGWIPDSSSSKKRGREGDETVDKDGDVEMDQSHKRVRLDEGLVLGGGSGDGGGSGTIAGGSVEDAVEIDDEFWRGVSERCNNPWSSVLAASMAYYAGGDAPSKVHKAVVRGMEDALDWCQALDEEGTEDASETATITPQWKPLGKQLDKAQERFAICPIESFDGRVVRAKKGIKCDTTHYVKVDDEELLQGIQAIHSAGMEEWKAGQREGRETRSSRLRHIVNMSNWNYMRLALARQQAQLLPEVHVPHRKASSMATGAEPVSTNPTSPTAVHYPADRFLSEWLAREESGRTLHEGMLFGGQLDYGKDGARRTERGKEVVELYKKLIGTTASFLDAGIGSQDLDACCICMLKAALAVVGAAVDDGMVGGERAATEDVIGRVFEGAERDGKRGGRSSTHLGRRTAQELPKGEGEENSDGEMRDLGGRSTIPTDDKDPWAELEEMAKATSVRQAKRRGTFQGPRGVEKAQKRRRVEWSDGEESGFEGEPGTISGDHGPWDMVDPKIAAHASLQELLLAMSDLKDRLAGMGLDAEGRTKLEEFEEARSDLMGEGKRTSQSCTEEKSLGGKPAEDGGDQEGPGKQVVSDSRFEGGRSSISTPGGSRIEQHDSNALQLLFNDVPTGSGSVEVVRRRGEFGALSEATLLAVNVAFEGSQRAWDDKDMHASLGAMLAAFNDDSGRLKGKGLMDPGPEWREESVMSFKEPPHELIESTADIYSRGKAQGEVGAGEAVATIRRET